MNSFEISILILQIINLVLASIGPLILAISSFIKRIQSSQCCGSRVDLKEQSFIAQEKNNLKEVIVKSNPDIDFLDRVGTVPMAQIREFGDNSRLTNSPKNKKRKRHSKSRSYDRSNKSF